MTVVRTDRLVLRSPRMADAPAIVDLLNDADMTRGLAVVPYPYGLADAESFIERRPDNTFAVCLKDGSLIGAMGLGKQLGYWFGKAYWGRGYATEAARALLTDHFAQSDETVISGYAAWNVASARVLEKLGFEETGDKMQHILSLDREVPAKSVALTKARWEAWQ